MAGSARKFCLWPGQSYRNARLEPQGRSSGSYKEIDLRKGLDEFFRGDGVESGKAHWVIVRHFDKTTYSRYWKPETREAVGGPAWEYTDSAILTYSTLRPPIGFGTDLLANIQTIAGKLDDVHVLYFFEHDVSINQDDVIFEPVWESPDKPVDLRNLTYEDRYNVKYVFPYRSDNQGRIEFKAATCRLDEVSWG